MSGLTADQLDWTTKFVGFGVAAPGGGASNDAGTNGATSKSAGPGQTQSGDSAGAANGEAPASGKSAKGFLDKFSKGKGGKGGKAETVPMPRDKAFAAKLKTLIDAIATLGKSGFDTKQMTADAADLGRQAKKAESGSDEKKRDATIKALSTRADEEIEHAGALSKCLKEVMGDKKGNPNGAQKSAIYKKALKDHYGIDIEVEAGFKNTHFDKMFDMFGTVPKADAKQDKLKKLKYMTTDGVDKDGKPIPFSGGQYGDNEIDMGDFGNAKGNEDDDSSAYKLDGKKQKANSFNVTALHEIGHAVDAKHNIMSASTRSKPGCGGWVQESYDKVTTALLGELKTTARLSPKATDPLLKGVIRLAIAKEGTVTQPPTIGNDDWQKILPFLKSHCLPIRDPAQPYFKNKPVGAGDRAFTEASEGDWWSYGKGARASTRVNNYQWRSPAEWFAEVYAITWLKKHKAPSAIDPAVTKYCWNG